MHHTIVIEGVFGLLFIFGISTACWRVGRILKIVKEMREDLEMIKTAMQRDRVKKLPPRTF